LSSPSCRRELLRACSANASQGIGLAAQSCTSFWIVPFTCTSKVEPLLATAGDISRSAFKFFVCNTLIGTILGYGGRKLTICHQVFVCNALIGTILGHSGRNDLAICLQIWSASHLAGPSLGRSVETICQQMCVCIPLNGTTPGHSG